MMAIPALLLAVLASIPNAAFGCPQAAYLTGFQGDIGNKIQRNSRRLQHQHELHHPTHCIHPNNHFVPQSNISRKRSVLSLHRGQLFRNRDYVGKGGVPSTRGKHGFVKNATMFVAIVHRMITNTLSKLNHKMKNAVRKLSPLVFSLALMFSLPMNSVASSTTAPQSSSSARDSTSYYLQNKPKHNSNNDLSSSRQGSNNNVISIQTQQSQPYSSSSRRRNNNDNKDSEYKYIQKRTTASSRHQAAEKKQKIQRISLFVIMATLAASTYRSSLRKTRIVRNASPFGRIRNASPLGNGVSVIRVCMALGFDDSITTTTIDVGNGNVTNNHHEGNGEMKGLLNKLQLEEKELITNIAFLAQNQQLLGNKDNKLKTKVLGDYLSNVASTFIPYQKIMRYGSIDSIRVPFTHEAQKAFRRAVKEERGVFEGQRQIDQSSTEQSPRKHHPVGTKYVLATILLAIKGDHTSIPLPFGIIRQRDMARILSRIVTDAKVEDCLVGSEVLLIPSTESVGGINNYGHALTEGEITKAFPDLVPLT